MLGLIFHVIRWLFGIFVIVGAVTLCQTFGWGAAVTKPSLLLAVIWTAICALRLLRWLARFL